MGKMSRVLEGRGVEGISEMAQGGPTRNRGATQNAMRAFSGHLIGIELLGPLMGD